MIGQSIKTTFKYAVHIPTQDLLRGQYIFDHTIGLRRSVITQSLKITSVIGIMALTFNQNREQKVRLSDKLQSSNRKPLTNRTCHAWSVVDDGVVRRPKLEPFFIIILRLNHNDFIYICPNIKINYILP